MKASLEALFHFLAVFYLSQIVEITVAEGESQQGESRKLITEINPGCDVVLPSNCTAWINQSLIHIQADGESDSLHFIWSFDGSPSLLLARSPLNSSLSVDWTKYLAQHNSNQPTNISRFSSSLSITGSIPYYTFGWSISNVWIFNDPSDKVSIDKVNQTEVKSYPTKYFNWERSIELSSVSDSVVKLTFVSQTYSDHSLGPDGHFKITVTVHNTVGYSDVLPYMLHDANNTQVDISFHDVNMDYPNPNFPSTRAGFGFTLVQQETQSGEHKHSMSAFKSKSLDDEHTPGVFEMYRIRTPAFGPHSDESYLQWKPICYTGIVRDITDSIDVHLYPLPPSSGSALPNETTFNSTFDAIESSILMSYYGEANFSGNHPHLLINYFNLTFGTSQDGFYNKTPHMSWTFLTGFGVPHDDTVSLLVILVLSIGLGIPCLMILGAGIYIFVRRVSNPRDDLLLGT